MKSKRTLFASIFQAVIGILAIAAALIVGLNGENMTKWIITLILALAFLVMGIMGIADYFSGKR
ncbi:MAG: hypothetical protein E7623_00945 [Ruminococcaceae bacterium]|nr:hypothetical protein [Oscillospiraceae bacterium]